VRTCVENGKTVVPEEVRNVLYVKKKIIFKDLYNVELSEGFYGI